jgi:hypothetical protein
MYLKKGSVILLGLIISTSLLANRINRRHSIKNITEAMMQLDKVYSDKNKIEIFEMSESEYITKSRFSIGLWIRYRWGLSQGSKLSKYFNDLGIFHPNDMSVIIVQCYYRHLHHQDLELNKLVSYYQERRKNMQKTDDKREKAAKSIL